MNTKKIPLIFRLILSFVMTICMFYYMNNLHISFGRLLISSISLFLLVYFAHKIIFALIYFVLGILLLADVHVLRVYGEPFRVMGEQLLNVSLNTNFQEIISYFNLLSYTEITILSILIITTLTIAIIPQKLPNLRNKYILTLILTITITCGYPYYFIKEYKKHINSLISEQDLIKQKQLFHFEASSSADSPQNVIIFIGESHRYDYFKKYWTSYPKIENILFFDNMIAQYGYTLKAIPQILSRKTINDETMLYKEPSIFKLYEEAGYETHFISYLPRLWKGDDSINFIAVDSKYYHQYGNIRTTERIDDTEILPILSEVIHSNPEKKKFIVIKIIGVHYNFEDRYPATYDIIKPSLKMEKVEISAKNKSIFYNTYENAMNYSVSIIYKVFQLISKEPKSSLIAFISDHGMNIFDNGYWNISNVKNAFHIPFLIYGNKAFMANVNFSQWNNVKTHQHSALISNDLFETIVSLSGISRKQHNINNDLTMSTYKRKKERIVIHSDKQKCIYELMSN